MRIFQRCSFAILMAAAISTPVVLTGCSGHVTVYDAYYRDYHPWDHHEAMLYAQWEKETHRPHMEYRNRTEPDQHAYWDWRHNHS